MSWTKVATLDELAVGTTLRVELDEPLCVVRTGEDEVFAVHDVCSHQEWSLADGWVEGRTSPQAGEAARAPTIECSLHGSRFSLETGRPDTLPAVKPVPTYAAKVEDGAVWVDPEQQTNDAPVPQHW